MVEIKFNAWSVLLIVLISVSFVYSYGVGGKGSGNPAVMGHSADEIEVTDEFCRKITGNDCPIVPYCGDDVCNNGETSSSCLEDCPISVDRDGDGVIDSEDCAPDNPDDSIMVYGYAGDKGECDCREMGLGERDCWNSFFEKGYRYCIDNKGADAGGTCVKALINMFSPKDNAIRCQKEDADDANGDDDYFYNWKLCV